MSMNQKVADVLEKVADYIEEREGEDFRRMTAERSLRIDKIASAYEHAKGEPLPDEVREKLAASDTVVLDLLLKNAHTVRDSESLGAPEPFDTEKTASPTDPDARFLRWLELD